MSKSIAQIKAEFENAQEAEWASLYEKYGADERSGVRNIILKYQKKEQSLQKERQRLAGMRRYEEQYKDCRFICGIDEAGRGPLAGPVVAGAVILPADCEILISMIPRNCPLQNANSSMMRSWRKQLPWVWGWRVLPGSMRSISFRLLMRPCVRLYLSWE